MMQAGRRLRTENAVTPHRTRCPECGHFEERRGNYCSQCGIAMPPRMNAGERPAKPGADP